MKYRTSSERMVEIYSALSQLGDSDIRELTSFLHADARRLERLVGSECDSILRDRIDSLVNLADTITAIWFGAESEAWRCRR